MINIQVYVSKKDLYTLQVTPTPTDLDNWYVVEMTEEEYSSIPTTHVFNPSTGTFVPSESLEIQAALSKRLFAYKQESDPLFNEWQYQLAIGAPDADAARQRWINKVNEIKSRYPKTTGVSE